MAQNRTPIGPYSNAIERGLLDGRTRSGRFIRQLTADLVRHAGGSPSVAERLLIGRICRVWLQLELLDQKIAEGDSTDHDRRTQAALNNSIRLLLREIGLRPKTAAPLTLAERLRAARSTRRASAARNRRKQYKNFHLF